LLRAVGDALSTDLDYLNCMGPPSRALLNFASYVAAFLESSLAYRLLVCEVSLIFKGFLGL
jgi:hypothetical protein